MPWSRPRTREGLPPRRAGYLIVTWEAGWRRAWPVGLRRFRSSSRAAGIRWTLALRVRPLAARMQTSRRPLAAPGVSQGVRHRRAARAEGPAVQRAPTDPAEPTDLGGRLRSQTLHSGDPLSPSPSKARSASTAVVDCRPCRSRIRWGGSSSSLETVAPTVRRVRVHRVRRGHAEGMPK